MGWGYDYYPRQPTIAELEAKANKQIAARRKAGHDMHPVPGTSRRKLADSWWGSAWCENLERYSDYENRIGRGKKYVKAGCVIDLEIDEGEVGALVTGSRAKPYSVEIRIDPLTGQASSELLEKCAHKVESLDKLLNGSFPEELKELFTAKGGLFPAPSEIHFDCSCPDWASMCKHVAATLYGIGRRFDSDPMLFFKLRGLDPDQLVGKAIDSRIDSMLANADRPSHRILKDDNWADVFGL